MSVKLIGENYLHSGGKAYRLKTRTGVEAVVTQAAGRLFSLSLAGKEVLFNNPEMLRQLPDLLAKYYAAGCKREGILDWPDLNGTGGEKTLFAPQMDGVPHPVPNIGLFQIEEHRDGLGVSLVSQTCPETGLQVIRDISIDERTNSYVVAARLKFIGTQNGSVDEYIDVAPWSVMQLLLPANIELANLVKRPEFFAGGPFGAPEELIERLGADSFRISLKPNLPVMAKAGYDYKPSNGAEQAMIIFPKNMQALFLTNISAMGPGKKPHGYRAESFWCDKYFEQELLNAVERLKRGETTRPLIYGINLIEIRPA